MKRGVLSALMALTLVSVAEAQPVWISAGGGYLAQHDDFTDVVTSSEYLEATALDARYPDGGGGLIDFGAGVGLTRGWSVLGGVGVFWRSHDISVVGSIPHPLYFAQGRAVEHVIADEGRREVAIRGELAWTTPLVSRLQLTLSGGPMVVNAAQSMATGISIRESSYPFDAVEVVPTVETVDEWGFGGTAAIEVAWAAARRIQFGVTGRFSRATVSLRDHDIDAAGSSVVAGLKFRVR